MFDNIYLIHSDKFQNQKMISSLLYGYIWF